MSRVALASLANGTILRAGSFLPAVGATAHVYTHGTLTPITIFQAEAGAPTFAQPITADSNGELPGWVDSGQTLDIVAVFGGVTGPTAEGDPLRGDAPGGPPSGLASGDLGGSYPNPTVAKVNGVTVTTTPATGNVLTATGTAAATWQPPAGGAPSGTAAGDLSGTYPNPGVAKVNGIAVTGTPVAGNVLTATDAADATWQAPAGGAPSGTAAGDLSGTYPNPAVAKVNGVTVTGTPAAGMVPTATGASAATWQAQTGVGTPIAVTLESLGADATGTENSDAAFQAAAKLPGAIITYSTKNATFKLSAEVPLYTDATHNAQGQCWVMWGASVTQTMTTGGPTGHGGAIFADRLLDGTTFRSKFTIMGGTWIGAGLTAWSGSNFIYRSALTLNQWTDIKIIGGDFSLFTAAAATFRGCRRIEISFTTIHDITVTNGYNAWNITDSINSSTVTGLGLEGQFIITGNISYPGPNGIATSAVTLAATEGNYTAYDAVIAGNTWWIDGFGGIFNEVNSFSAGAGDSVLSRVLVSDTIIVNTGTAVTSCCLYFLDDGPTPFADALKMDLHRVDNCILYSASNSTGNGGNGVVHMLASRSAVQNTTIIAAGTNGCCVFIRPGANDTAAYQDVNFSNVDCFQTNTGALSRMVQVGPQLGTGNTSTLTRFRWMGGRLVSSITAQASVNTADGIFIGAGVSNWELANVLIENAGNNGISAGITSNYSLSNVTIHNPNSCNNVSSSAGNGILLGGVNTGAVNEMTGVRIYDDRGTHQMYQGIQWGATSTTKATIRGLTIRGALNAPMNTPIANGIASITGYETDVLTGYGFNETSATAGASPFTTTAQPYDQMICVIGGTVSNVTGSRNSISKATSTNCQLYVRRNETITITYSVAPTVALTPLP